MSTPLADDFASINEALRKIKEEKVEEAPKAWPDYTSVDQVYTPAEVMESIWGHYRRPYSFKDGRFYRVNND